MNEYVKAMTSINNQEMKQVKLRAKEETKYKTEAMTKLEGLRVDGPYKKCGSECDGSVKLVPPTFLCL